MPTLNFERPKIHVDFGWKPCPVSCAETDAWAASSEWLLVVGLVIRPGVVLFLTELEHEYFPPIGPVNDLFQIASVEWPHANPLPWNVAFVPMRFKPLAAHVATRHGLRLADGVPQLVEPARETLGGRHLRMQPFPYHSDNVFTLESEESEEQVGLYDNRTPRSVEMARLEAMQARGIIEEFREKYAGYFQAKRAARGGS